MMMQPLFEFPSACVGCGETSYIRLASQLFGDRMWWPTPTGCSSIYGGNLPNHALLQECRRTRSGLEQLLSRTMPSFGLGFASASTSMPNMPRAVAATAGQGRRRTG